MAWQGWARPGRAGVVWPDRARLGWAGPGQAGPAWLWLGSARHVRVGRGTAWPDGVARHGSAGPGLTRRGAAGAVGLGAAGRGKIWRGQAWQGKAGERAAAQAMGE
jgi:hypothetical protein